MVLSSERQRDLLMQIVTKFPNYDGTVVEEISMLKAEIMTAPISPAPAQLNDISPPSGNGSSASRPDDALQHRA